MLGLVWLLKPYLDPSSTHLVVINHASQHHICGSGIWLERGLLVEEFIPGVECYGQADQQDIADHGGRPPRWIVYCNPVFIFRS